MSTFATGDSALAYQFTFSIDQITVPSVIDVSGLKLEVEKIESKVQTSDGKYVISHMPGPTKAGEITVTRVLTNDTAVTGWLTTVMGGDLTGMRHTATVAILDTQGNSLKSVEFDNVWVQSVETGEFKAGATDLLTEKFVMTYTSWSLTGS